MISRIGKIALFVLGVLVLVAVLLFLTACMPQARVTQVAGRAELSREHTVVTISDVVPPPQDTKEVIHIRIADCPKEPAHENASARPDAARPPR